MTFWMIIGSHLENFISQKGTGKVFEFGRRLKAGMSHKENVSNSHS